MLKVLISAAFPEIGRELVRLLSDRFIICLAHSTQDGSTREYDGLPVQPLQASIDVTDKTSVARLVSAFNPDIVIHFGYLQKARPGALLRSRPRQKELTAIVNILSAAPRTARFIYAVSQVEEPSRALHSGKRRSAQGNVGEQYVRNLAAHHGLPAVIVRLRDVVESGRSNSNLIAQIVEQLKEGHSVVRLGRARSKRAPLLPSDAARGLVATAISLRPRPGQTTTVELGRSHSSLVVSIHGSWRAARSRRNGHAQDRDVEQFLSAMAAMKTGTTAEAAGPRRHSSSKCRKHLG